MAGMKKLYSSKPALQSFTSLSSSEMIHLSVSARSADSTIGKLDRNLDTFQSLVRNFFVDSIFCSEHLKSFPWLTSLALQNLKVSAPNFSIIGRGSRAFPLLFDIFSPFSSKPYPIIHASDHGFSPVRFSHRRRV